MPQPSDTSQLRDALFRRGVRPHRVEDVDDVVHVGFGEHRFGTRSHQVGEVSPSPTGRAIVSIMASIAELELELGKERRAASRTARIAAGLPTTCPPKLPPDQARRMVRLYEQGEPTSELAAMFGVSRRTVFRTLARHRRNSAA